MLLMKSSVEPPAPSLCSWCLVLRVPGVMMMLLASLIMSMVWSTLTSVWVPTISMGLPPAVDVVPNPPMITLGRERFMASGGKRRGTQTEGNGLSGSCTCGQMCLSTHHTHDVGEDGTGGANQSSDDRHQVVFQEETLGAQSPARVAVQHGDDHGHVSTPDGCCQSYTLLEVTRGRTLFPKR